MYSKRRITRKARRSIEQKAELDYQKFFSYLPSRPKSVRTLLQSIDKRASLKVADFIASYLQRPPNEDEIDRTQRGRLLKKKLPRLIKDLKRAAASYRSVAEIQIPEAGSIIYARSPLETVGMPFLADTLEREAARFAALLIDVRKLYNEKRFGVSRNHLWLVLLLEFVAAWTKEELKEEKQLTFSDIADLIEAGKVALGWTDATTEADSEQVRKAIRRFRSIPTNKWISTVGAATQAQFLCKQLKSQPFLLGIEI